MLSKIKILLIQLLTIGVLWFPSEILAQNSAAISKLIKSDIPDNERIEKIENLLSNLEKDGNDSIPYFYQQYAFWAYNVSKNKAVTFEKKALELAQSKLKKDSAFIQKSAVYLGFYYEQVNDLENAIASYEAAIFIDKNNSWAIKAYEKIGYDYLKQRDYHRSIPYFELVIDLLTKRNDDTQTLISAYSNLIYACYNIKSKYSFKKANDYSAKFDSLIHVSNISDNRRYYYMLNLADLYNQHNNFDLEKSLSYYNEAMKIAKARGDSTKIGQIQFAKGSLYNTTDLDKSISFLEQANDITKPTDTLERYLVYTGLATSYARKANFKTSLEYRHRALKILVNNDFKEHTAIDYKSLVNSDYINNHLSAIPALAETYLRYFEQENDPKLLDKSIAYFKLADYATDLLKLNSSEYKSRLFWRELSASLYGKAIKACYLNNDPNMAFYFMEKNKALLLLEDISKQRFTKSLGLSKAYLKKEEDLRKRIYLIEANLKESYLLKTSATDSLQKLLVDSNIELSRHQDSLNVTSKPFNVESKITTLADVQRQLKDDEIVLEYHISIDDGFGIYTNNDKGYVLAISKDESQLYEIPNMDYVKDQTLQLLNEIKSPFQTASDITSYAALSYSVYNLLFPTEGLKKQIEGKRLRVIPDGYISFLPFEALSTTPDVLTYLITQSTIQYQYSNSFLNNIEPNKEVNNNYLSVIPEEFSLPELSPLRYSSSEIESLKTFYDGTSLDGKDATKFNFLAQMEDAGIIHLATHANAQDSISPWIAFTDEKLNLEELYLTRSNASLVFLSGCNTTLGKQEIGEGIMSLARGFFYSGAQSVVSTLWNIDDKSTSIITQDFYKNLSKGQTKSESLRNAKLSYLKTHNLSEASPYHWASFIVMGDNSPIKTSHSIWPYLLVGALVLAVIFWIRMRRKSTT